MPLLTVGELAARSGVAPSALRFYEEVGLIRAQRTPAGHRRFPRPTLRRVAFIVYAQRVGLTLDEVRAELATLPADRAPNDAEWAALSRRWVARIDARMEELQRLRRGLTDCIGCGCLSLERCHVLNRADQAAAAGTGPRFWLGDDPGE